MTLFNMVALLVIPVFLTFYFDEPERWYLFSHAIDAVFICDIVIWFFTGYYDYRTQLIVLDPRIIARYTKRSTLVKWRKSSGINNRCDRSAITELLYHILNFKKIIELYILGV